MVDWSKNPFWDTLNIMLKSSNLKIPLFVFHLQSSFLISLRSSFDLNVIYSQSCGHLEAFGLPISPKTSSQQPCFWRSMKKNTLYFSHDSPIYRGLTKGGKIIDSIAVVIKGYNTENNLFSITKLSTESSFSNVFPGN